MDRNLDTRPYTEDERRVATFIVERSGIGGGDDPIGFLLASYALIMAQRNYLADCLASHKGTSREVIFNDLLGEKMLDTQSFPHYK